MLLRTTEQKKQPQEHGFTLLEIILVLAIVGLMATVVLPNLNVSIDSKASVSITNITSQITATYDDAVFTGRQHRMVFDIKEGTFWTEEAPPDYQGRAPLFIDSQEDQVLQDKKNDFIANLADKMQNNPKRPSLYSKEDKPTYYSLRSIPQVQSHVLTPVKWEIVNDATVSKKSLAGGVVFAKFSSALFLKPLDYHAMINSREENEKFYGYIYFFPDGTCTPSSIQIALKNKNNEISNSDLKYTLNLNTLTGQVHLLEGFQDANFKISTK